jgi:uncharacterized membrane protein
MFLIAHGALGWYDELIFLGIAVIFIAMMIVSWFQSRMTEYDDDKGGNTAPTEATPDREQSIERFELD